jgi:hypothetical protein
MKILVVATKAPWPPVDGGRLLLRNTLDGLAATGCRTTLVAPVDPARFDLDAVREALAGCCEPRLVPVSSGGRTPSPAALVRAIVDGTPLSIVRHALPAVRREVQRTLDAEQFDLVHVEQLQALTQAEPAFEGGVPVVLRAQNVESDLWREAARRARGWRRPLLALEARRLARWEGEAVRRAATTLALTEEDATRLRSLGGPDADVAVLRAPFPELPSVAGDPLSGDPAVVVLGSGGWMPNEDSVSWFLGAVWPVVLAAMPGAVLHLFGAAPPRQLPAAVVRHPAPEDSAEAFRPGSLLAVPLRIASGVRMKVLEAWSRGVPVVGTPAALAGLDVEEGGEALVAEDALSFAGALTRLHREPGLAARLVAAGRQARCERHNPSRLTSELLAAYARAVAYPR